MNESQIRSGGVRLGVWTVGACGDIAATTLVGAHAISAGLTSDQGLITACPPFSLLPLASLPDFRFGGVEVTRTPLREAALSLYRRSRTVSREVLDATLPQVEAAEADVAREPDLAWDPAAPRAGLPPLAALDERLRAHIRTFRARHDLDRVVVVNLMSSLPHPARAPEQDTLAGMESLIAADRKDLVSPSVLYAWAALSEGCPYVNFTPNAGTDWDGIAELAERRRLPFYGDDGKTGETLVKTALAHLFAFRNLRVLSWEGVNLLGNNDGRSLDVPRNREMKLHHKESVLDGILGYRPHAGVTINYVPSLGDWKTAWDLIHFQGFLDVPMTMQFTWQGCDSILAAPLVLDLVRFADYAARRGEHGLMHHLAAFFKHPVGVTEMDFHRQFGVLLDYAARHLSQGSRD